MSAAPGLALGAVDFGWGSSGKLSAIIGALRENGGDHRLVVLGTRLGRRVLSGLAVEAWYERWPRDPADLGALLDRHAVAAGLVVLDPELAVALEAVGRPTVYVDSLPYLWTDADAVPSDVAAYCAQMCPVLPSAAWGPLRRITRLHWVGPVIRRAAHHDRAPGRAVVNLGGLHSPSNPTGNPVYLRLVLRPVMRALAQCGIREIHICGNAEAAQIRSIVGDLPRVMSTGPRGHGEFLDLLAGAELLVTSPGLTTLLEALDTGTPTVCLPPQNLSQIFNADRFADLTDSRACVRWSGEVLDRDAVERARAAGEEAALRVIDGALRKTDPDKIASELETDVVMAIAHVRGVRTEAGLSGLHGTGAAEVTAILRDVVAGAVAQRLSTGVP
ncbi:hydroxymethylcytosylglucuronate/cytosylglucuronate synthase [Planomonospora parontospora]|uniref:hydroxymethylcytosylglucuronate/cytosylglucurona te synthase n=1 Tax=Planomonospora parontospora TaxID=58119 RepID=UPI001670B5D2|nr:hydroxymethylcytosylglucuronate/cytosylglucuronate synthase [Planomonospora parontospora]GGL42373.1 hypothetical protein GCM10014719_49610 [Planomonospora parontospora subsp. antibiotica]GII18400.1 hypothetical protein Ppa05_51260 [Planomonospora parontospora subsp. antibiotica]